MIRSFLSCLLLATRETCFGRWLCSNKCADFSTLLIIILSVILPSLPSGLSLSPAIPQGAEVCFSPAASCPWTAVCVRFHWAPASQSWSRGWGFPDCSPRPSPLRGGKEKGQLSSGRTATVPMHLTKIGLLFKTRNQAAIYNYYWFYQAEWAVSRLLPHRLWDQDHIISRFISDLHQLFN